MNRNTDPIHAFLIDPRLRWLRHLSLWTLIVVMSIGLCSQNTHENTPAYKLFFLALLYGFTLGSSFYLNIFFGVKRLLVQNRFLHYLLFLLVLIVVDVFLVAGTMLFFFQAFELPFGTHLTVLLLFVYLVNSLISILLIIVSFSTILLLRHWIMVNDRKSELAASTLKSELDSLKKQINPHFLFNMLNNAHVLIKKRKPEAEEVIFKLEDMLRYQMDDSSKESVKLVSDISFLRDFLNLEKIRRDKFEYFIVQEGKIEELNIPPLLFIPFVVNAVKYSKDSEDFSFVRLTFRASDTYLYFECVNSKPEKEFHKSATGGLGLKNIKRRLELLYPDRHWISIADEEKQYTVLLKIEL